MSHFRIYEPIELAAVSDDGTPALQVTANVTRGAPDPIRVGCYPLTVDQSRALRLTLERAERDVRRGPPQDEEVDGG
jgi:hypothetical protein